MDPAQSLLIPVDTEDQKIGPHHILNFRVGFQAVRDRLEVGIKGYNVLTADSPRFPRAFWSYTDQETGEEISENFTGQGVRRTLYIFLETAY